MTDADPVRPTKFRTGGLSPRKPTRFAYAPGATLRQALAGEMGLLALPKLEFSGQIAPDGRDAMLLTGTLTAECDQPCIVTLAPVRSRITEAVRRRYVAGLDQPDADEMEMPEDDTVDPMPEVIDIAEIAAEALMLALPLYPRAPGAELGSVVHAGEGVSPLSDADLKPFAGLAALAGKLATKPDGDGGKDG
ncbi:DUF177 domain-containing protein [Tabrizicola sp.]|uniref:YceD family protein n=1 Tax=Tabrizicola sp. TaxID=2005166 RepID=UPI0026199E01|nr:DUF177 domain-containing protein [Tabrizicola sp.]MDM7931071.1 DUF177 domain-containing protein [Tabrizicola sp.]